MSCSVLILSREAGWSGGVVNFIGALKSHLSDAVQYQELVIGQRRTGMVNIFRYLYPFVDAVRLYRTLTRQQFDIVHLNPSLNVKSLLRDGLFMWVLRAARVRRALVLFHGWEEDMARQIAHNRALRVLFWWTFGHANRVLVLARAFKETLQEMGFPSTKVEVVTTMFEGEPLEQTPNRNQHNGQTLLFLSRFIREKGVCGVLKAFEKISARFPQAKLILAGDGPERCTIETWVAQHQLSDRVCMPGYLRGGRKAEALHEADIFVLPTTHGEGCPVALLEAMGAGLPVITTRVGGIPDIVQDGRHGILLERVTPDVIAEAITRLLSNDELRQAMGEHNRREAWAKYEATVVTCKIEQIYMELAANG